MKRTVIDVETLRQRIKALKEQLKGVYGMRRLYGESGFRGSKITDDFLKEAQQKETQIREYEALLKEAEKS